MPLLAERRTPSHDRKALWPMPPALTPKSLVWPLLTAAIATCGGAIFTALGMPTSWLMGAMFATAVGALAGLPLDLPPRLREVAFLFLGISIGSSVTPESVRAMLDWPVSLALLFISVAATMYASSSYLRRVHGWDDATARFASMPGAFSSVAAIASTSRADIPRVMLAQSSRIFILVALMPLVISLVNGGLTTSAAPGSGVSNSLTEVLVISASGLVLALLLNRLGVPAGSLLGAMLASATLHATGVVHGRFPQPLLIFGFVATGAVIGARFRGTTLATIARTMPGAIASVLIALVISAGIAAFGAWVLDAPFGQIWLAYAPGGVEAMSAMALVLNLEPAFVGGHHLLRIIGLSFVSPFWFRKSRRPT